MSSLRTHLDPKLRSIDLLFDSDALSELFRRPVRASHLRWKRGTSAVARLHDDDGVRWVALYGTETSVKLEKTSRRALAHDLLLERFPVDDGVLASGSIAVDPRLYGALRPFRRSADGVDPLALRVLKYNPFRRLVLMVHAGGGPRLVGRVSASGPAMTRPMFTDLADRGVPVLVPLGPDDLRGKPLPGLPAGKHVEYLPWYGAGDLSTLSLPDAALPSRCAGEALARLHRQPPLHLPHTWRKPAGRLRSLVRENALLMPESRNRLERVQAELVSLLRRPGRAALIHGDFSADQVLVSGRNVRLIDFEHCTYGAAGSDLGSFTAVEATESGGTDRRTVLTLPRTAALLEGYGSGYGSVNESEVLAWTAFHLLNRLREPFRACDPQWRQHMERRLDVIEEILW